MATGGGGELLEEEEGCPWTVEAAQITVELLVSRVAAAGGVRVKP